MTYLGVDWKVLEASERHLTSRQVEPATITLTSLKLKASYHSTYDIEMETYSKVLNTWPGHCIAECNPLLGGGANLRVENCELCELTRRLVQYVRVES